MLSNNPYIPPDFGTGKAGAILWILTVCREFDPDWTAEKEANKRAELEANLKEGSYWISDDGIHCPE